MVAGQSHGRKESISIDRLLQVGDRAESAHSELGAGFVMGGDGDGRDVLLSRAECLQNVETVSTWHVEIEEDAPWRIRRQISDQVLGTSVFAYLVAPAAEETAKGFSHLGLVI